MQWRAVDSEGEVLEILIQPQRDNAAALRLLRKLFRRQGFVPTVIVTTTAIINGRKPPHDGSLILFKFRPLNEPIHRLDHLV